MKANYVRRNWTRLGDAAAYSGIIRFAQEKGYKNTVKLAKSLAKIDTYSKHKPARKKFQRRHVVISYPNTLWAADLMSLLQFKHHNQGFSYILSVIDIFSKFSINVKLKRKDADSVLAGFKQILKNRKQKPRALWVDFGGEWYNKKLISYLRSQNIEIYSTRSKLKSVVIERYIKTYKDILYRVMTEKNTKNWIDHMDLITKTLNNTRHSSHNLRPSEVTRKNADLAFNRMFGAKAQRQWKTPAYKKGDFVRLSVNKISFAKSAEQTFSSEVFEIGEVIQAFPVPVYRLKTKGTDEYLEGTYYEQDLSRVIEE